MKKIIYLFAFLCSANLLLAQVPQSMNYQGVARKANGEPLLGKAIKIRFSIVDATPTTLYSETHSVTTNQQTGIFSLSIGAGTPVTGIFATIDWTSGSRSLKIEMDENGGNNFTLVGTNLFQSVPYALQAEKSRLDDAIAIFEERRPSGAFSANPAVIGWNNRVLSYVDPNSSNVAELDGYKIKFNQKGKYLITATAPCYSGNKHKLALRDFSNNNLVLLTGSSNYTNNGLSVDNTSKLNGILNVTDLSKRYTLDHYMSSLGNSGAIYTMGNATIIPGIEEVYAQIMIQKISN